MDNILRAVRAVWTSPPPGIILPDLEPQEEAEPEPQEVGSPVDSEAVRDHQLPLLDVTPSSKVPKRPLINCILRELHGYNRINTMIVCTNVELFNPSLNPIFRSRIEWPACMCAREKPS